MDSSERWFSTHCVSTRTSLAYSDMAPRRRRSQGSRRAGVCCARSWSTLPLRPVPARPPGPVDPAMALREVRSWLPALDPPAARALALGGAGGAAAGRGGHGAGHVRARARQELAAARKELRQTLVTTRRQRLVRASREPHLRPPRRRPRGHRRAPPRRPPAQLHPLRRARAPPGAGNGRSRDRPGRPPGAERGARAPLVEAPPADDRGEEGDAHGPDARPPALLRRPRPPRLRAGSAAPTAAEIARRPRCSSPGGRAGRSRRRSSGTR